MTARPARNARARRVAARAAMAVRLGALGVVGLGWAQHPGWAGLPASDVPVCRDMPRMDGALTDPCWRNAARLSEFHVYKSEDGARSSDPVVCVARDDQFLYLALQCENPAMRFLEQHGVTHDDPGVGQDDSVELFLTREGLGRYYHYMLNYANVQSERRIAIQEDTVNRDLSWSYPWLSATEQDENGWTAEVAIPLELLNTREPGDVRLNILRNKTQVELDAMGSKISERRAFYFWSPPTHSPHEPESFGILSGLREQTVAPAPFLVVLDGLETGGLAVHDDRFSFTVSAMLLGVSPVAGQAVAAVIERLGDGAETVLVSTNLSLPPRGQVPLSLTVPVTDFSPRTRVLRLTDRQSDRVLDSAPLPAQGALIQELYPEFSYYSGERTLRLKVVLDLSGEALADMSLQLRDREGASLATEHAPSPETVLSADAGVLAPGANALNVRLIREDGKVFGSRDVTVTRLESAPASESKVDHFRRIVWFKGEPFFPFGMVDGATFSSQPVVSGAFIQAFQRAKMNTLFIQSHVHPTFNPEALTACARVLADANINVIFGCGMHAAAHGVEGLKAQEEKERFMRARYEEEYQPNLRRCVEQLRMQPNLLAWCGIDEANLGDWKSKLYVAELFGATLEEADPHHVIYSVYARTIPRVPEATDFFHVLGYDIYTYPNWNTVHARICDPMAAQIAQLDIRASETRHPIWAMPQPAALDPVRCPRPLTGQEQLCQSYTALIYGSKGLLYFTYGLANSEDTWQALETLGRHVEALAPALLNDPVKQTVTYDSGAYQAERWQIPPVPWRFFRFPSGALVALAVNSKNYPVDLRVKMESLSAAQRLFGGPSRLDVRAGEFADSLKAYDVRAYALEAPAPASRPVEVFLAATEHPEAEVAVMSNETILADIRTRKNLIANPSFEIQTIAGRPDFYMPYKVVRLRGTDTAPADFALSGDDPKFGAVSLRLTQPEGYTWAGVFGLSVAPPGHEAPHVFSFYAKASPDKTRCWVGLPKRGGGWAERVVAVSTDWRRYSMPCPRPGGMILMQISEDTNQTYTLWLDGLQLEPGETPTEFAEE